MAKTVQQIIADELEVVPLPAAQAADIAAKIVARLERHGHRIIRHRVVKDA